MRLHVVLFAATIAATRGRDPQTTPIKMALDPLPMSDVTLTGEWALQQQRNRENLLSINLTAWGCHFTTTANLTACEAATALWHTYTKRNGTFFTEKLGFLAAGDDVKPSATVSFAECKAFCASATSCAGFTFQAADDVPTAPIHCYWKTTVAHFTPQKKNGNCLTAGDPAKPACSPLPGEMGLGGYYGHFQGHWLSATAFLVNNSRGTDLDVKARADAAIDLLADVMAAWKRKYLFDGYLFPYDPLVWRKLLAGHGAAPYYTVPFYTLHKLMAGLLDQYVFAGSRKAFTLVCKMALWVHDQVETTIAAGGEALWQRVLLTEWGGMNDVLLELYRHTHEPMHYATARRFNGWVFTARLAAGVDDLSVLPFPHANFHLPEIVGNARAYELTGNATDAQIVHTFFDALTANHSCAPQPRPNPARCARLHAPRVTRTSAHARGGRYCTGGSNSGECWQAPRDLGAFLSTQTEESCTQYNVLKVARHLHRWTGHKRYADFYETAITNGIVGNQKRGQSTCGGAAGCRPGDGACRSPCARGAAPNATSYIYMLPLGGAVTKAWGKSDYGFPCCWGTLSESFAKLSDSIFFAAADASALHVELFESARAEWAMRPGIALEQTGHFPLGAPQQPDATTTLVVRVADRARGARATFALKVRVPSWLAGTPAVALNGQPLTPPTHDGYLTVKREWNDADQLDVAFPARLWAAPLNDKHAWHNATVAFMYGPLVLAGVDVTSDIFVPPPGGVDAPASFIARDAKAPTLEFVATAADGRTMRMRPLRDVMDERYVVYFYTAGTKPPQPAVHYCPHSHGAADVADLEPGRHSDGHGHGHGHGSEEEEEALISAGAPSAPPLIGGRGRGVQWAVSPAGQMLAVPMATP